MPENTYTPQWFNELTSGIANNLPRIEPGNRERVVSLRIEQVLDANLPGWRDEPQPEPHADLKEQYALDDLLHPEGKSLEWWELAGRGDDNWQGLYEEPGWHHSVTYRRKSTAPDWSKELSPKEVAECADWPEGYFKVSCRGDTFIMWYDNRSKEYDPVMCHVWCQKGFIVSAIDEEAKETLLDHFQKRREAALLEQAAEKAIDLKPEIDSGYLHSRISEELDLVSSEREVLQRDLEDALFKLSKAEEAIEDRDNTISILKNETTLQAQILKMWEMWHKDQEAQKA